MEQTLEELDVMAALGLLGRPAELGAHEVPNERSTTDAAAFSLGDAAPVGGGMTSVVANALAGPRPLDESNFGVSNFGVPLRYDVIGAGESRHRAKGNREEREDHFHSHL